MASVHKSERFNFPKFFMNVQETGIKKKGIRTYGAFIGRILEFKLFRKALYIEKNALHGEMWLNKKSAIRFINSHRSKLQKALPNNKILFEELTVKTSRTIIKMIFEEYFEVASEKNALVKNAANGRKIVVCKAPILEVQPTVPLNDQLITNIISENKKENKLKQSFEQSSDHQAQKSLSDAFKSSDPGEKFLVDLSGTLGLQIQSTKEMLPLQNSINETVQVVEASKIIPTISDIQTFVTGEIQTFISAHLNDLPNEKREPFIRIFTKKISEKFGKIELPENFERFIFKKLLYEIALKKLPEVIQSEKNNKSVINKFNDELDKRMLLEFPNNVLTIDERTKVCKNCINVAFKHLKYNFIESEIDIFLTEPTDSFGEYNSFIEQLRGRFKNKFNVKNLPSKFNESVLKQFVYKSLWRKVSVNRNYNESLRRIKSRLKILLPILFPNVISYEKEWDVFYQNIVNDVFKHLPRTTSKTKKVKAT